MAKTGNKGEWSEIYIFLKLLIDGKVYAADKDLKRIPTAFLNILKIIREEIAGKCYHYVPGSCLRIFLNGVDTGITCTIEELAKHRDFLWNQLKISKGSFQVPTLETFLSGIFVTEIKSPSFKKGKFRGGTEDVVMEVSDYKTGLSHIVGFSCKSEFAGKSSLFNASGDNTNFIFQIEGPINDLIMSKFNEEFKLTNKKGVIKKEVATSKRIEILKKSACTLKFVSTVKETTETNLTLSGGLELPEIVSEMLRHFYYDGNGSREHCSMVEAIDNLASVNPIGYKKSVRVMYGKKVADLLYDMFTGLKMAKAWDGKRSVNGGYIVVLNDGDVLAYHSCLEDEFKDFLITRLGLEAPSCKKHDYMYIYKENGKYFLKLNLQVRFINTSSKKTGSE